MKPIHWFSLAMFIVGLAMLFAGFSTAGAVTLVLATAVELLHSILTGKQTNDSVR